MEVRVIGTFNFTIESVEFVQSFTNSETSVYKSNVIANGGTVSGSTLTAIDTFISSAKSNSYWSYLDVVLPFSGDQLVAGLTPLKVPSGITVTNNGFVSGDYSESTGITPATNKYLTTSYVPSSYITDNVHCAAYLRANFQNGSYPAILFDNINQNSNRIFLHIYTDPNAYWDSFDVSGGRVVRSQTSSLGLTVGNRISSTDSRVFQNGSQLGAIGTSSGSTPGASTMNVFGHPSSSLPFETRTCSFISWGRGIPVAYQSAFYADVQALQTALGRQV